DDARGDLERLVKAVFGVGAGSAQASAQNQRGGKKRQHRPREIAPDEAPVAKRFDQRVHLFFFRPRLRGPDVSGKSCMFRWYTRLGAGSACTCSRMSRRRARTFSMITS